MRHVLRLFKISRVAVRHGFDQLALERLPGVRRLLGSVLFWRDLSAPRGERLRLALEALGPIFVKFGQMLSTRRDLLPPDIADELAKLQDQVPPFGAEEVNATLVRAYGRPVASVFRNFNFDAAASASVAQVHFAELPQPDGSSTPVAVKILRPQIATVIAHDLGLLRVAAGLVERLFADGKRLRPRDVVAEFERHLEDELDLMREAANCSQLRRNFAGSALLLVPQVHWDLCRTEVMVMERMHGVPVSQVERLREAGVDIHALARTGLSVQGAHCLDVGQGTGGFTEVLLASGAAHVVGVDVGHGQLHPSLRAHAQVSAVEGVNARSLTREALGALAPVPAGGFDLLVADLSFIPLTTVLPALVPLLAQGGALLALVKPQFELQPQDIGKGGLVKHASAYAEVERKLREACLGLGLGVTAWLESAVTGGDGNREFFIWAVHEQRPLEPKK